MDVAVKPHEHGEPELGFVRRYLISTDHKVIGKQYMTLAAVMALLGGLSSYIIRWQLAWPETSVPGWGPIGPDQYNGLITMHGTIMVFFVAMPFLLGAFGNFLIPLMVGADDMAFPRLNAMSFWTMFTASAVLVASMFAPEGPRRDGPATPHSRIIHSTPASTSARTYGFSPSRSSSRRS